jgi:CarboxypepD_reg-like domain
MKKGLLFFFLVVFSLGLNAQKIYVMGKVLDKKTLQPVDLASIKNIRTQSGTKTNKKGDFFLPSYMLDSIEFSSIGYKSVRHAFKKVVKDTVLYLEQEAVQLQEVVIFGKNDQKLQAEINDLLSEPERSKKFRMQDAANYAGISGGSLSLSPITMLYDAFSKEGKSKRRLAFDIQQDRRVYYATFRFNRIAGFSTKLSGEELEKFKDFSRLSNDFILNATDYDLTYSILQAWKKYKPDFDLYYKE